MSSTKTEFALIPNPTELLQPLGQSQSIQFVLPVKLNDDDLDDFIVVYWAGVDSERWGQTVTSPTPDFVIAQVSQPDSTYKVDNKSVFGTSVVSLGGASRKVAIGDINGDGVDDFAFAMNWEDGRLGSEWDTNSTRPAVLLSKPGYQYEVKILGEREWGHSVELINNAEGTKDVVFSGYTLGRSQIFRYSNGEFIDVASEYPNEALTGNMKWANSVRAIQEPNSGVQAEYIVGAAADWDRNVPFYSVLKEGLELYKRDDSKWALADANWLKVDFTTPYISWQETLGTVSVFSVNGQQYFNPSIQELTVLPNSNNLGKSILVARVAASQHRYDALLIEGELYNEDDADPVAMYLFYEQSGDALRLLDEFYIEPTRTNANFFDYRDINEDGFVDLISYAFTEPWRGDDPKLGGKPFIYVADDKKNLMLVDLSTFPTHSKTVEFGPSFQSILHDVNNDGYMDLVLFGTGTNQGSGDIEIHFLKTHITLGSEILAGTQSNDVFKANLGDDYINALGGRDTIMYSGAISEYTVSLGENVRVRDLVQNRDGQDALESIERLQFSDLNLALDTDGVAGQAYRIYKAAFDRAPDLPGLGYWINDMDKGASLETVAGGFIASEEFLSRYGSNSSNVDFIRLLYENVLDRQPDTAGYEYWQRDMANGMTREKMLINFSESNENKQNVAGLIENGIEYTAFIN
jgi:hypothetical protein